MQYTQRRYRFTVIIYCGNISYICDKLVPTMFSVCFVLEESPQMKSGQPCSCYLSCRQCNTCVYTVTCCNTTHKRVSVYTILILISRSSHNMEDYTVGIGVTSEGWKLVI